MAHSIFRRKLFAAAVGRFRFARALATGSPPARRPLDDIAPGREVSDAESRLRHVHPDDPVVDVASMTAAEAASVKAQARLLGASSRSRTQAGTVESVDHAMDRHGV